MTNIPLVDVAAQQREILDEIRPLVDDILATGAFIGGPHVSAFEEAYAKFSQVGHCVGVANGTDALEIALRAVGVVPGSEVVLPANTFIATAEAVARIGARVVLVDADDDHLLMDTSQVEAAVTPATAAVVPVHLYGQLAPVDRILDLDLPDHVAVVEDAAQSHGATRHGRPAGTWGRAAAISFYPGKNLGAAGDAGAVVTNDERLARLCRLMGAHGSEVKYVHEVLGFNSRLDSLQAVVLMAKLRRVDEWNAARQRAADTYDRLLADVDGVRLPRTLEGNDHVWHLYVVRVPERDRVLESLNSQGVGAAIHYPTPVHLAPAFGDLGYGRGDFPVSEAAADGLLSLPIHGQITLEQQERVVEALRAALSPVTT
jgi:dTDP-4-amino-4,6-dideoxygalactose transaminase